MPDPHTSSASWPVLTLAAAHARLTGPGARFETMEIMVRGQAMTAWKNFPATAREAFAAGRAHGTREFLVLDDVRVTFESFSRAALAVAAALKRDGLKKGDPVALAMRNRPEWPVIFLGTLLAGGIAVPLNGWWTGPELTKGLTHSGSRFLFCDAERMQRLTPHLKDCPALERVYPGLDNIAGPPSGWAALPEGEMPAIELKPEDDATLLFTSGTTALPRAVLGTHRNLTANIAAQSFSVARNALRLGAAPTPGKKVMLLAVPFFHSIGCMSVLMPFLAGGGTLVLMHKFDAAKAAALIAREGVTNTGGVPAVAMQLADQAERGGHDLSSLTMISYGGSSAPPGLATRIAQAFPGTIPGNAWGMTETSATCTIHSGQDYLNRPESCGPALPVYRVKVIDAAGRDLPPGEVGELWAFGPNVAKAYWKDEAATQAHFVDGWVRTGDLAQLDDEGFCTILGRMHDMLIRGGENIHCGEVENALHAHPDVADAAVVPLPHPLLGEVPGAVVRLKPGAVLTETALRDFAGARLAAFKLPARILFWPDALPRNAGGKILRTQLLQAFDATGEAP